MPNTNVESPIHKGQLRNRPSIEFPARRETNYERAHRWATYPSGLQLALASSEMRRERQLKERYFG